MKRVAPAAARNAEPIARVLDGVLPPAGLVLEVASGTGEHALYFARCFPDLIFQPSDPDPDARASIAAWREEFANSNLLPPLLLDAATPDWPLGRADAILCINMAHISPWQATLGLLDGAARLLPPGGLLYLYGPYVRDGVVTAPSNIAFDQSLRARNPEWGLRRLAALVSEAAARGLDNVETIEMPANNLSIILRAADRDHASWPGPGADGP